MFKKYLEENSQAQRLERVISGIKKEKRLRSNDELLTEVKKFKIQYSKEMEKINHQINIAKNALKKKRVEENTINNGGNSKWSQSESSFNQIGSERSGKNKSEKKKTDKQKRWHTR